jgi:hypothetical protein
MYQGVIMPAGRPTDYNKKTAKEICRRLIEGESLRSITRDDSMPCIKTVYNWMQQYDEFLQQYCQARDEQIETYADEIIEIADDARNDFVEKEGRNGTYIAFDNEHVLRSRLRIDTRKWIAERMKPKKYGAKTEVEHNINVNIHEVLKSGDNRIEQYLTSRAS